MISTLHPKNTTLKFISQPEGYIEPNPQGGFDYVYQYKDHLGNVRLSYSDSNKDGVVVSANTSIATVFSDGFESASGWDGSGNTWGHHVGEFDSTVNYEGNYSARLDREDGNANETVAHSNEWVAIDNSEPTEYRYSGWVFLENIYPNRAQIYLFMKTEEETGYNTAFDYQSTSSRGQWVFMEKTVTVPAHIKKLNLRIDNDNNGKVWFDNLKVEKLGESEIVEENNYYPFGLKHKGYNNVVSANSNSVASKFKYNGVEFEEAMGLNNYEMFFRQYDPAIARWTAIDPVTHFDFSTYSAFDNNPVYFADPSGADSEDYYGKWDLEWGGYGMDPGDRGYSNEGQNRGYFLADFDSGIRLDEIVVVANGKPDRYANEDDQEYFDNSEFTTWGEGTQDSGRKGRYSHSFKYDDFVSPRGGGASTNNPFLKFLRFVSGLFITEQKIEKRVFKPNESTMDKKEDKEEKIDKPSSAIDQSGNSSSINIQNNAIQQDTTSYILQYWKNGIPYGGSGAGIGAGKNGATEAARKEMEGSGLDSIQLIKMYKN